MNYDVFSILGLCGIAAIAFWLVGLVALLVAVRKGRSEFRTKGFLRPPSGMRWLRFLLWKQYDYFGNPTTRFFFGVTHFCLMGTILVLTAGVVLLGSEVVLKGINAGSDAGMNVGSRMWLPK